MSRRLDVLAATTPVTRDRYMDLLRAVSIFSVVFGHWMVGVIFWEDGLIRARSVLGVTSFVWLATWVLQVMPLFFFVGGFSNMVSYDSFMRRGEPTWAFIRTRAARLLRPSLVFLCVWIVIQVVLHLTDIGRPRGPVIWGETQLLRGVSPPAAMVPFGPLWFLAVYLIVVTISPLTIALNRRFGWWVPAVFVAGAFVTDIWGFGTGSRTLRFLNVPFTLLLPHQLGHLYADGRFARLPRRVYWAMALGGLGLLIVLTNPWFFEAIGGDARFRWFPTIGHYPKSTLGTDVGPISNAFPPTLVFMAVGIWTIGAAMLLRERLTRWLQRVRAWKTVIFANSIIMTLFLWHMTAYLVAIMLLWPLGFGRERSGNARWWLERPLWVLVPAIILTMIVAFVARYERPKVRRSVESAAG